jgi:hypothetical protein
VCVVRAAAAANEMTQEMETPEPEPNTRAKKRPRGYGDVALRELRRARKLVDQAAYEESIPPEASFALQVANVLALLDLAAAIRGQGGGSATDS